MALPAEIPYPHIEFDADAVSYVSGTTMKVVELVEFHRSQGWGAEELHEQFPHLSLAQIHSALAYYYDHRESLDAESDARFAKAEALRRNAADSSLARRLRAMKTDR